MFFFFFPPDDSEPTVKPEISDKDRKLRERAPKQISAMVARINHIRSKVDDEIIQYQLKELALACEVEIKPVATTAHYSADKKYRYDLSHIWDESAPYVLFICLHPSGIDTPIDKTTNRCIKYAKSWGKYGGVHIANLFAISAPTTEIMMQSEEPVGNENDKWLLELADSAAIVIAAWGKKGSYLNRANQVRKLLPKLHGLKMTSSGEPAHPLYLEANLRPDRLEDLKHKILKNKVGANIVQSKIIDV